MTRPTTDALTDLLRLAEEATPGEWEGFTGYVWLVHNGEWDTTIAEGVNDADAAFIAAANPTAVKALVEEVLALRGKVERVEALADEWENLYGDDSIDAAGAELRSALEPR